MGVFPFYARVVLVACRHSIDWTQLVLFLLVLVTGFVASIAPPILRPLIPDLSGWRFALWTLGAVVALRLLLAPYWLWQEQRDRATQAVAAFAERFSDPPVLQAGAAFVRLKLMLAPGSSLSPERRLKTAEVEFHRLADRAMRGDAEARHLAPYVAEWLQDAARRYYGSSAGFHEIESAVLVRLEEVSTALTSSLASPTKPQPSSGSPR